MLLCWHNFKRNLSLPMGVALLAIVVSLFAGCKKHSNDGVVCAKPGFVVTNVESVVWKDLPDSASIVVVGDRVLTKIGLLNTVSNEYYALVARGLKKKDIADKFEKKRTELAAQHITRFMQQSVFSLRADELGIDADGAFVAAQWGAISNQCRKMSIDVEKYARISGHRSVADLDRFIRDNNRYARVFDVTFSNRLTVTEREVDDLYAKLEEGNRISAATNAVLHTKIKQLKDRLEHAPFPFVEDDEENEKKVPEGFKVEWFVKAPANSFDDEESVVGRVRYQKVNTWAGPFEDENAFSLYYMKEIEQKSSQIPTLFTGFRVFCEKDHGYLVPDKKKLMADMRARRNIEVVTPEFERLCRHYGVIFPYGFVWRDVFK